MKQLIKKRWFVFLLGILIAVIVFLIFGIVLYCNGYRIIYPEQFETSWDAVSGFAAWFEVVTSTISTGAALAAVWAAIQIPKEIARQQNKISLINYRLEINQTITEIADDIIGLRDFSDLDLKEWDISEELPIMFSFATITECERKRRIIGKYSLYFADYSTCAEQFSKLYYEISWNYLLVKKLKGKSYQLNKLAKTVEKANRFVQSNEFYKFKKYMNETMKVSN